MLKSNFKAQATKKIIIFPNRKYSISFKPIFVMQGAVVLLLLAFIASFFIPDKINQELVIKSSITKQTSAIVAGGNSAQWSLFVKKSDITQNSYLAKLPKSAENIKITTITSEQAEYILNEKPVEQLSLRQRQDLALANQKNSSKNIFARITSFVLADLSDAAESVTEAVVEAIVDVATNEPEVTQTLDAIIVDLSAEADTPSDDGVDPTPSEVEGKKEQPASAETSEPEPDPVESPEEFVKVEYETPAPEITEQATNTGKLVTISDSNTPKFDCESLNPTPAGGASSNSQPTGSNDGAASLLTAFTNAFKSITKFLAPRSLGGVGFTADLEQAVTQVIESVVTPEETTTPAVSEEIIPPVAASSEDEASLSPRSKQGGAGAPEGREEAPVPVEEVPVVEEQPAPVEIPVETPVVDDSAPASVENFGEAQYQACLANQVQLTNVLAFTNIPEIYKVGQETKIKIKWTNENNQDIAFHAYDTNDNGKLDYVEWTVPHLSEQVFEIIFISKAFELDSNKEIVSDIYDTVKTQDGAYATIPATHYIRVTFEKNLTAGKDMTIYARGEGSIIVFNENGSDSIGEFAINGENTYKIYPNYTDSAVYDLLFSGNIDVDYIVDPSPAGPNSPGTLTSTSSGIGSITWTNPTNAQTSNNGYATCVDEDYMNATSYYLVGTNFGFSIPTGSTINGIVVNIERKSSTNDYNTDGAAYDQEVFLTEGSTKSDASTVMPTSDTVRQFGGGERFVGGHVDGRRYQRQ